MNAIALRHVCKSYTTQSTDIMIDHARRPTRTRQVLRDVHVTFPLGKLTVLVGRSGCGKSTLLRLLSGQDTPDAGEIIIPEGWHSAVLSPDPYVITWTSVLRNVAMACGVGRTPEERLRLSEDFVRMVGLEDYADLTPAELSTGMKQRLGLARVLASQAELLLMDEPFAALDFLTRAELQAQLLQIQKSAAEDQSFSGRSLSDRRWPCLPRCQAYRLSRSQSSPCSPLRRPRWTVPAQHPER